ncbi:MAG: MBL fold metallo-hydrolase [Patescibacteria group bacterium]
MKITFYGGAGWVTGANYLLEGNEKRILVDCGLFQGSKYADDLNYQPFGYDPKTIDFVFVTHSHIDHIGRLPKLFKEGFSGVVYATSATRDLIEVALPDNLEHITREAKENGHEPLYEKEDVAGLIALIKGVEYRQMLDLGDGISAMLHDAGHILGSAFIEFRWSDGGAPKKLIFSGDLGNPPTPLLRPTEFIHDADYIVIESAYGDRAHEDRTERRGKLAEIVIESIRRGGVLMIPSFSLERTQELLYELNELHEKKIIPQVPIFVDSPLAIKMTAVYQKHHEYFNRQASYLINSGDDVFAFPGLRMTASVQESKAINDVPQPKIIIAGSGMSQGGRILHHEIRYLPDPNSAILMVGYQVMGSRGRKIMQGDSYVNIFGENIPVRCRVLTLQSYSAHADQPTLLHWLAEANSKKHLKRVFIVQGEERVAKTLATVAHERLGIEAIVPIPGQSEEL